MKSPKDGVQSVSRALILLQELARSDDGLRVSDLARTTGLAVSTAHRLLTTLEQHGFAQFDAETTLWHVGREAFAVGSAFGGGATSWPLPCHFSNDFGMLHVKRRTLAFWMATSLSP